MARTTNIGATVIAFFRELARGLYCLPSNWETPGDRRMQIIAILATLIVVNYITVAYGLWVFSSTKFIDATVYPDKLTELPVVLALTVGLLLFMRFKVVTDDFLIQILQEDSRGENGLRARKRFLNYAGISILLMLIVLTSVVLIGAK